VETAVNAVWDGGPGPGDRIVVVGAGVVGLLVAWLSARIPGTEVLAIDPEPGRRELLAAAGVRYAPEPSDGVDADLVFHASGRPEGLESSLRVAGVEATIVELSWYGTRRVDLPLGEAFHARRLTLRSSQVGRIPPCRQPRWTHRRRMEVAVSLLDDPWLDLLFTDVSPFDALPRVMQEVAGPDPTTLCRCIRYPAADALDRP
jgi:threonine dehydrogenase-like Zn-dependent dehydrogenase